MILQSGVKLRVDSEKNKVFINNGVCLAGYQQSRGSINYDNDAYVPAHNWRNLSLEEKKILLQAKANTHYSKSILLRRLPDNIISLLKRLNLSDCKDYSGVLNKFIENAVTVTSIQEEIKKILYQYSKDNSQLAFHRIVFNPPQIETLTYYINEKKLNFVGLHIDRSTIFDFTNVQNSKNRLCINVAEEDRTIYFVNLTLNQILKKLNNSKKVDISQITVNNIGTLFFQTFPNYPIIKVIQSPYEYYIMPTDNVLHDGSTLGKNCHDICLVYLGYFNTYPSK